MTTRLDGPKVLLMLAVLAFAAPAMSAPSERRACTRTCKQALKTCLGSARAARSVVAASCAAGQPSGRACRRAARVEFVAAKRACQAEKRACIGCCRDAGGECAAPRVRAGRIDVLPGTLLLAAGETRTLTARVLDPVGQPMAGAVTWISSAPEIVEVDASGQVTARGPVGSAAIVAELGGTRSRPAVVAVAEPVPGALLVRDAEIVGKPEPVDPSVELDVGARYRVTLTNVAAPAIGTIVLGAEDAALGGRVVDVQAASDGVVVVLEVVPLDEMFQELVIDEAISLAGAPLEVPAAVRALYDVTERDDGTLDFVARDAAVLGPARALTRAARGSTLAVTNAAAPCPGCASGTRAIGPYECEFTTTFPLANLIAPSFSVTENLVVDFRYDSRAGGLQRLALRGSLDAELKNETSLTAAFEGKVECRVELGVKTIPIGGPLSLFIGGQVPYGVGFEVGGKVTVASVGFTTSATTSAAVELGVDCPSGGDCVMLHTIDAQADGQVEVTDLPDFIDDFSDVVQNMRVEPALAAFGFVDLALGAAFNPALRFQTLTLRAGLGAGANLAALATQLQDPAYRSDARLTVDASAGAGRSFRKLLDLFEVNVIKTELKVSTLISESPAATRVVADVDEFEVGDPVRFTVELDSGTTDFVPVGYNVREIRIYHLDEQPDGSLQPQLIVQDSAQNNQLRFDLQWTASFDGRTDDGFFAVAMTTLPTSLVVLELGPVAIGAPTSTSTSTTISTTTTTSSTTSTTLPVPLTLVTRCGLGRDASASIEPEGGDFFVTESESCTMTSCFGGRSGIVINVSDPREPEGTYSISLAVHEVDRDGVRIGPTLQRTVTITVLDGGGASFSGCDEFV